MNWKYARLALIVVLASLVAYIALLLLTPAPVNNRYNLSHLQLLTLRLTIIIPISLTWLIALRGSIAFKNYAASIHGSRDAKGLNTIANGLLWTLGYFIITGVAGAVLPYFAGSPAYNTLVIIRDHLAPLTSLLAFYLLYRGSTNLSAVADFKTWTQTTIWVLIGYSVFAVAFVLAFAYAPIPGTTTSLSLVPREILLVTLIMPYLAAWFLGLLAGINIAKYAARVKGVIYRQALGNLVRGIWAVIAFGMAVQAVSLANRFLTQLSLSAVLLLVYGLIFLYSLSFLFIRAGAKKLALIEAAQ